MRRALGGLFYRAIVYLDEAGPGRVVLPGHCVSGSGGPWEGGSTGPLCVWMRRALGGLFYRAIVYLDEAGPGRVVLPGHCVSG